MNEPTDSLTQHHVLAAVRTLLQTVQEPLAPLVEALQAPDQLLADLTPALDVVAFSPFAGLTVSTPEAQQPAPKPPLRSTGVPPVATAMGSTANQSALPPTMLTSQQRPAPPVASANVPSSTTVTPVFALPSQKRTATIAASPLAQAVATPEQQIAQPATSSPIVMAASVMAKVAQSASLLDSGQSRSSVRPSALPDDQVDDNHDMATTPPLATMTLLATVVDSLLTTTPSARLEPAPRREPGRAGLSSIPASSLLPAGGSVQWSVDHEPALHPSFATGHSMAAPADQSSRTVPSNAPMPAFSNLVTEWPAARGDNQLTNQPTNQLTNQLTNQPTNQLTNQQGSLWDNQPTLDPWTLAQLINDVLAEEARRHGVDLS